MSTCFAKKVAHLSTDTHEFLSGGELLSRDTPEGTAAGVQRKITKQELLKPVVLPREERAGQGEQECRGDGGEKSPPKATEGPLKMNVLFLTPCG